MKTLGLIKWIAFASVLLLASCKDVAKGGASSVVTGATNEILVVMNKALWDGAVGDSLRTYLEQPQFGLPQPEPMFDLINLPLANFEKNVRLHRNVLMVEISPRVDTATLLFNDSPWARSQKVFKIVAPNETAFYEVFDANKERIMGVFLKAERDRMIEVYKKNSDVSIFNTFKNKYHMILNIPGGYIINKDTNDFVWISSETRVDSKGVIFFQENYTSQSQFNYQIIIDRVNEELKKYIPGPLKNSWMALDTQTPVTASTYNYTGGHYAVVIKGLWTVVNDFMGGPFVLNVVLDEAHNRVIYMMGYVYAPDGKKRNMLRQVESIVYTMNIDYEKTDKEIIERETEEKK